MKIFRIVSRFEKMDKHNENQDEQRNSGTAPQGKPSNVPQGKPSNVSFHLVHETIFKGRRSHNYVCKHTTKCIKG